MSKYKGECGVHADIETSNADNVCFFCPKCSKIHDFNKVSQEEFMVSQSHGKVTK